MTPEEKRQVIIDIVRAEKDSDICLLKPKDLLSLVRYVPYKQAQPGSGTYGVKAESESFLYRFYGPLDYSLHKYGDKSITVNKVSRKFFYDNHS